MARGPRYKVPRKRRREGKTNYYKRYRMIISGQKIRAVVRKTNKHIIVQIIKFAPNGDETLVAVHSKTLRKMGWLGDLKNTSAAYLTGLIAGLKAKKMGIQYAVPDIGLHPSVRGSRIYAAIKGLRDAGVEVPASEEVLPSEDRVKGEHIAKYADTLSKEDPERFRKVFSKLLERGLDPENLPKHFEEVKHKILSSLGEQ
ncbi:MAG: 50S ribosomal protein L18 [Desulfurococcales archaeon]|nr:50S ribosomal protein L18 [Desulfurococcales archaeon]